MLAADGAWADSPDRITAIARPTVIVGLAIAVSLRALLLPDGRVIVEYLLTLPPQNGRARGYPIKGSGWPTSYALFKNLFTRV